MTELSELIERIRQECGFELFLWGLGRTDLNDTDLKERFADEFVRARYNLTDKARHIGGFHSTINDIVGGTTGYNMGMGLTEFDVIAYGFLPEVIWEKPKTIIQQKRGLMGKLGLKETITTKLTESYKEQQPISNVVNTTKSDNAYFLSLTIRNDVHDGADRRGGVPQLAIITTRELAEMVINYLKRNPNDYMNFIKALVPAEKFPNANRGIITDAKLGNAIVFLDVDSKGYKNDSSIKDDHGYLDNRVYEKYGKRVEVK